MSWTSGLKCKIPTRPCTEVIKASRVALLGASSRLGACVALLLKRSSLISKLELYDCSTRLHGYVADLINIDTGCEVTARVGGRDALERAVQCCDIAVMLESKGTHESNPIRALRAIGRRIANYSRVLCETNPRAIIAVCCEPVEALVPLVSSVFCSGGWYYPGRIIGSCSTSEIRCNTGLGRCMGLDPFGLFVPIVGGVSGERLVPIFSHALPTVMLTDSATNAVVEDLRRPVLETISSPAIPLLGAHAVKRLVLALCAGLAGKENILVNAFVASDVLPCCRFLASPVLLGHNGVKRILNIPRLSEWEVNELSKVLSRINDLVHEGEKHSSILIREQEKFDSEYGDPNILRACLRNGGLM